MFERVAVRLTAKFSRATMETRPSKMMSANTECYTQQKISYERRCNKAIISDRFRAMETKFVISRPLLKDVIQA